MPNTKQPPVKNSKQIRIKTVQHKDDLRVLTTASPDALARAVVQGFGVQKSKESKG